ncbi:MAG: RcnB family protein [Sphingomonas sp.]|nr:RcnB family protein [Sphingomonas sp.]
MRKSFFVGLLAAVALVPGAALAQDEDGRPDRMERRVDGGGPRFQPAQPRYEQRQPVPRLQPLPAQTQFQPPLPPQQIQRPDRAFNQPRAEVPQATIDQRQRQFQPPAFQPQVQPQVQPQPQAPFQRGFQPGGQGQFRPDRPNFQGDPRVDRRDGRPDGRPDWQQNRGTFGGGGGVAVPQVRGPQPDFRGDNRQGFNRDQRPDFRNDNRQGFRGDYRQDYRWDYRSAYRNQPNYRGDGRFGNGYRGAWNRDWRRDNRWDWQTYRSYNRNIFRLPQYYAPYGWSYGYRRFSIGYTLNSILFDQRYWIDDPYYYRLPDAYYPYEWVRYYGDALLVDVETGEVVDVVYGIFY